jgi:hypothetical protein
MAIISKGKSEETKVSIFQNFKEKSVEKVNVKTIFSNMDFIIKNPIDPKRISKFTDNLNVKSALKALLIFGGTIGTYCLIKNSGIFSYFGWGEKNSKDIKSDKIAKIKDRENDIILRKNLKTKVQDNNPSMNRISQIRKNTSKAVKFEEKKIEEFKNLPSKNDEDITLRRLVFNPTFKGSYDTPGDAKGIFVSGNYAYVADGNSGLQIVDVSEPSNPKFKGSCDTPEEARRVVVSGDYAYVAAWFSGLQIIDISDPSNPTFKGAYGTPYPRRALDVAISDNYAYVTDDANLLIIDISDPSNPTLKGECYSPSYARAVVISENYAYVADFGGDLEIIYIFDPSDPTFVSSCDISGNAYGIDFSGNYAYLVGGVYGLQIIDVSNPSNPSFKGAHGMSGEAFSVTVSGNYAYVGGSDTNLQIIDVSDPSSPIFEASYEISEVRGIVISGNYAYLAAKELGLQIIALGLEPEMNSDLTVTFVIIGSVTGAVCISSFCFLALIIGSGVLAIKRNRNKTVKNENDTETKDQELEEESAKV